MEITVDPSAIVAVLFGEPVKDVIITYTRRTELIAPPSLGWEVGNALSAAVRRKRITAAQASQAFRHFGDIPVRIADIDVVEAVQLSFDRGIFAYDAYIIQCALRYRTPLLTLDRRQAEVASNVGVALLEV